MPLYYFLGRASGQKETAEAVSLYLNAVGIRVKVEGIDAVQLLTKIRDWKKSTETVFVGIATVPTANYPDPMQALDIGFESGSPISLYKNPSLDEVVAKARREFDDKKRAELIKQAFKIIHDDVATALLWNNVTVYAMQKNIAFTPTKSAYSLVMLKDIGPAK